MKKITVLGAGLVGKLIAIDLSESFAVTTVDHDAKVLEQLARHSKIKTKKADLSVAGTVRKLVADSDLVVGAVPGNMGFNVVREVIEAGKNMVDISFFPEDPFELDGLAKNNGCCIVTDCGVAPGMGNLILGYHNEKMRVQSFKCLVGGLPFKREWPWEYRAVFSPIDVIEEYTRPARYVQNGDIVIREALSDPELIYFENIGTLEAWNSDGLRSLIKTMNVPNMIEKTLRYPGTIEYLRVLRDTGYFSHEKINIDGVKIKPIDLTSKLLFSKWKLKPDEKEFTVMRVELEGFQNGLNKSIVYDLFDQFDEEKGFTSMARTTGYTCTAVANILLKGKYSRKGINPPELLGKDPACFHFVFEYLKERGVVYKKSI
ncbi:saccharopine dehydrogenase family protein [Marinifilum sp. D714]|uniref:saccharopine dehydrogenase family protein n=1 Tax=Marinifilum sp. D714 TaxID=2937523 RepID=UPI0027BD575C|nr:saccharopine dehydrogenase C-terminal domain-containing protein [Marinifilum sp. D714]MDQ2177412.1 saccharopine dehydrogenase NADP-binding domain-containing protein [Marinifilum sp. D714]